MSSIDTFKAIGSAVAGRLVGIAGWVAVTIIVALVIGIIALANTVSHWWYVLFVPITLIALVVGLIFWIAKRIIRSMYPRNLTKEQRKQLVDFSNRTIAFARERAISLPGLGASLVKDALIHQNLGPLKSLFNESSGLYQEYKVIAATLESTRTH